MFLPGPRRRRFGPQGAGAKISFSEKCSTHHVFAPLQRSTGAQGAGGITARAAVEVSGADGRRGSPNLAAELILRPGNMSLWRIFLRY